MGDKKTRRKQKKDSQLVIRISKEERDAFVELCEVLDTSASREIRRFMKAFVNRYENEEEMPDRHDVESLVEEETAAE